MTQKISTKTIVLTGLMAALTVIGSAIRVTIPISIGGNSAFHLGNIMCVLSGVLLGPWIGGFAAGIGSMIYDLSNPLYISEAWMTFLMKGACGLFAGLVILYGKKEISYPKAFVASAAGAISYALLYLAKHFFYKGLLLGGLTPQSAILAVITKLPSTIFNAVVAMIFAPILAIVISKALEKNHLSL